METAVDRALLLEFFLVFSRFEYALKASGLFKRRPQDPPKHPKAEPDWDSLAVTLRDTFDAKATDNLHQACQYLQDSPTNQQVIVDGELAWETQMRPDGEKEIDFLLRMVRCVRNNLFHGGKHNIQVHEDTQRTEMLLRSSLIVLDACLQLSPRQLTAYHEAHL